MLRRSSGGAAAQKKCFFLNILFAFELIVPFGEPGLEQSCCLHIQIEEIDRECDCKENQHGTQQDHWYFN
jgi:hypothetical protein